MTACSASASGGILDEGTSMRKYPVSRSSCRVYRTAALGLSRMSRRPRVCSCRRHCASTATPGLAQEPRRLVRRYADDLFRFVPSIARSTGNMRLPRAGILTAS